MKPMCNPPCNDNCHCTVVPNWVRLANWGIVAFVVSFVIGLMIWG